MQINRNMSAVRANNQLLRIENKLSVSMERLSSGLKINHASDNPAGIAISNKMKAQIDALDQAESNASDAVSVLQITDGALNEVASILQRMRELSVQAANGTNEYSDRQSIQSEIDELKEEVDRISKNTEYNTKTLLDGSSDVRVYAKNASRFIVSDAVEPQVYSMNVTEAGQRATVEMDYDAPNCEGRVSINGVVVNISAGMTQDSYLQEIRNAATEAGCSVEVDTENNKILLKSNYYGYNEAVEFTMSKGLAEQVALRENEDCTYVINEAVMTFTKPVPTTTGVISIAGSDVEIKNGMTDDEYFKVLKETAEAAGYNAMEENGELIIKSENSGKTETIEFSFTGDLAESMGIIQNFEGEYQVNTAGKDAVVTIPKTNASVLDATGFTATSTVEVKGNRVMITDNGGFSIDFLLDEGYAAGTATEEGNFKLEVTDIGAMTIQIGANQHQEMEIRISEVSTQTLYIDDLDVSVAKGADKAMDSLDKAIAALSANRSKIGAFQNRLEYAATSLSSTSMNVTSAYSGIMDTDMADEMTEYTQQNILNQAAVSVLAQANELPQQILSLLQ